MAFNTYDPNDYQETNQESADGALSAFFAGHLSQSLAEVSIMRIIEQGSGGPENVDITERGLRFIRYLLCVCRGTRYGFMPNFKNVDVIRKLARDFISTSGNATLAMNTLEQITSHE